MDPKTVDCRGDILSSRFFYEHFHSLQGHYCLAIGVKGDIQEEVTQKGLAEEAVVQVRRGEEGVATGPEGGEKADIRKAGAATTTAAAAGGWLADALRLGALKSLGAAASVGPMMMDLVQ